MTDLKTSMGKTQSIALTDLKQSQIKDIIVLKNNKKNKIYVTPINDKEIYKQNDTMTFSIKPEGYHFLDFNTLCLTWDYGCYANGTMFDTGELTDDSYYTAPQWGSWSCIKRIELIIGSKVKEDLDLYNVYTTYKILGIIKKGYSEIINGTVDSWHRASVCFTKGTSPTHFFRFQIPLYGCLEAGGWLPIYNLALDLRIRITFEKNARCLMFGPKLFTGDDHVTTNPAYHIKNARLSFNCINVTVGGKLDPIPYTFSSKTHSLTQFFWKDGVSLFAKYLQLRHLSVQKMVILQITDSLWSRTFPTDLVQMNEWRTEMLGQWERGGISQYLLKLGGVNYPFQDPVNLYVDMYNNYLEYFNAFDSNTMLTNRLINYDRFFKEPTSGTDITVGSKFSVCVSLQQLPFNNKILSGINLELTPVHILLNANHIVSTNVFVFATQDIIVSFSAGTINIEN